jgi:5-methyltetrahydrofolate--homocysteine methyltransferase
VLIETVFDTLNAKAAIHAARRVDRRAADHALDDDHRPERAQPLGPFDRGFWASVRHARPLSIGLNCSFGAAQLRAHIAALSGIADTLIMAYPNAGLPNDLGEYDEGAADTAAQVREWASRASSTSSAAAAGPPPTISRAIARDGEGL